MSLSFLIVNWIHQWEHLNEILNHLAHCGSPAHSRCLIRHYCCSIAFTADAFQLCTVCQEPAEVPPCPSGSLVKLQTEMSHLLRKLLLDLALNQAWDTRGVLVWVDAQSYADGCTGIINRRKWAGAAHVKAWGWGGGEGGDVCIPRALGLLLRKLCPLCIFYPDV